MKQGGGQNRSSTSVGVLELPIGSQRGLRFPGFYKPSSPAKNVIKANQINGPNAATCDGAMGNSTLPQLQQGPQQDAGALRTANMVCNHSCRSACACAPHARARRLGSQQAKPHGKNQLTHRPQPYWGQQSSQNV